MLLSVRRRLCLFVCAIQLVSCSQRTPSSRNGVPSGDPAPSVTSTASPNVAPKASAPVQASAAPLPPLASVKSLFLRLHQGGPKQRRCAFVAYEITIDLVQNTVELRDCDPKEGDPPGNEPLRKRPKKKLSPDERKTIEAAYAALSHEPGRTCGKDNGAKTLVVTTTDGSASSYVDAQSGCGSPPPEVAVGLPDFLKQVAGIAFSP